MIVFLAALGLVLGIYCFAKSFSHWDAGLHLLIVVLLFGGIVGANLGSSAYPIFFRDMFIVLPLYLGLLSRRTGQLALAQAPLDLLAISMLLFGCILLSIFNSAGESALEIVIATKVWLYYIPFLVVGLALAREPERMLNFFRQFLFWGLPACAIGLAQSLLVRVVGYEQVMSWFFGSHAIDVTQNFTYFEQVGGVYRIPGTFSFVTQYSIFLHFFLAIAMIESNFDPQPKIRRMAQYAVFLAVVAALLSGAREAIIFIPATLVAYGACGLLGTRLLAAAPIGALLSIVALKFSGLELLSYFDWGESLVGYYANDFLGETLRSLDYGFLGAGLGASSTAARYAIGGIANGYTAVGVSATVGLESYFSKAGSELGWLGFAIILLLMMTIALRASAGILQTWCRRDKVVVVPLAAMVLYAVVVSYKGKFLDVDPGNILTWIFLGLTIGLSHRRESAAAATTGNVAPMPSTS